VVFAEIGGRREPLIRFEGHYFDRLLRGHQRQQARQLGLAHPKAGKIRNPRSQQKRWDLINRASAINRVAALSSTSWGLGQVMGAHWQWLGFENVDELVAEARSSAAGQVRLMARYIDKAGLVAAVQAEDWKAFASAYNGPFYWRNAYDKKIQIAYQQLKSRQQGEKLTVQNPVSAEPKAREEKSSFRRFGDNAASLDLKIRKAIRDGLLLICKRIL
jgi:hypothetical protein